MHPVDRIRPRVAENDQRDVAVPAAARLALAQDAADLERLRILQASRPAFTPRTAKPSLARCRSRNSRVPGSDSASSSACDMEATLPAPHAAR
jgi:hypothetical protein